MKTNIIKSIIPTAFLLGVLFFIGTGCDPDDDGNTTTIPASCTGQLSYKLDGTLISFDHALVTAEIFNDAAIGKFYDIWTDENNGFYYHSTITETSETSGFDANWFTTSDVANIVFLNSKNNVNMVFTIEEGANAVGEQVTIKFSGTYDDNGTTFTITEGKICTTIDIAN